MKRIVSLLVLGVCAWPALASVPELTAKTKRQPQLPMPQQIPGIPMQIPPTIPRVQVDSRVLEAVAKSAQVVVDIVLGRIRIDGSSLR